MRIRSAILAIAIAIQFQSAWISWSCADEPDLPPGDTSPLLRLETNGPRSYVSGMAFSPDGRQLYATGWDKAIQVWNRQNDGQFAYSSGATLRIPTGAGPFGRLNALALSSNGKWLAAAGQGQARQVPGERSFGWVLPAGNISKISQLDTGTIYVFNTAARTTTLLRGHRGPVQSLAFVENSRSDPPELVSAAEEQVDNSDDLVFGLRFWNVQQSKEIGSLSQVPNMDGKKWQPLPDLKGFRPGLLAWSTGLNPNQSRVAVAWGDDQFRIWDVTTGQVANSQSNPNLLTILPLSSRMDQIVTGAHAQIGHWSILNGVNGQLGALSNKQFQPAQIESVNGRSQNLPNAGVLIPATATRPQYLAFVVTRYLPNGDGEYRLMIATASLPIRTVREILLPWQGEIRQPAIAVSNDSQRMALAGNDRSEIEIHQINDLLNGRTAPQVLGSVGLAFRDATFVRSADDWGLRLSATRRDESGRFPPNSLVFDVNQRQVETTTDKWRPAAASLDGWSAAETAPGAVAIRRAGKDPLVLNLIDGHRPTATAICPVSVHCPVPLIAIASQLRGQPLLQLFNGDTGEAIRWCVGHTERIRAVSFSEDGRMLLSVSDDRTVSVWTTTDLVERTLGKHAQIPGVTVNKSGARLIVTTAPSGSSLQKGDEIVSAPGGDKPITFESTKDFYKYILRRQPGQTVELSVLRQGNVKAAPCVLGQAIDEARPLFSLFVMPAANNQGWEWIGWHPLGNFDLRGDRIDQSLGWHFNTGEAIRPARFAAIGEYRDSFYRRDLLRTLIETQKPPAVVVIQDDPKVAAWLRQLDGTPVQTNYDDVPQLVARQVELVADVSGISERRVRGISVTIDNSPAIPLNRAPESEAWTANLSSFNWQRGIHRMTVQLKTSIRDVAMQQKVHFHPAAPEIQWAPDPAWGREITTGDILVDAAVIPTSEPIKVQLLLQPPGTEEPTVLRNWESSKPLSIHETVAVSPGESRLELIAWNSTAPADVKDQETARFPVFVRRALPPMAPRLSVNDVSIVSKNGEQKSLILEGDSYRTVSPAIRIKGNVSGKGKLGQATIVWGDKQQDLNGFRPDEVQEFEFDESLTLQPGRQSIAIQAAVADEKGEKRLFVVYEPSVPRIDSMTAQPTVLRPLPPATQVNPLVFLENYHEQTATISAALQGSLENPYRVAVRVNDELIADANVQIQRSPQSHLIEAKIPLRPGKNGVSLDIDNEWTRQDSTRTIEISYLSFPEILEVKAETRLVDKPLDLTCRIRSASPIRSTRIVIDDVDEMAGLVSEIKEAPGEYLLVAEKIGLKEGEHVLRITATNDDGTNLQPAVHNVAVERPAAKAPTLEIISPTGVDNALVVSVGRLEVQYAVVSSVPATVQVKNRAARLFEAAIGADAVRIDGSGSVHVVELNEGVNELEFTARNAGGFSERQALKVSFVPPAATVEIVTVDGLRPRVRNDGFAEFEKKASKSRVELRGRVITRNRVEQGQTLKARIWVNNFKLPTVPVIVDANNASIGTFSSAVTLSRPLKNEIKVEVYCEQLRVASEMGCTNTIAVDCEKPERRQDLYLVLMGTASEDDLRQSAQKCLQARIKNKSDTAPEEMWESDAFSQIHVFRALNVHPVTAQHRLVNVVRKMNGALTSASKSGSHAIVMIYFQGQIVVNKDDFSFITSDGQAPTDKAVTGRILETTLTNSYGAHLLFLDLTQNRDNLSASDIWPKAPQLGIEIYNWKGQGRQPNETRLITALEQTLPQVRVVRELAERIDQHYEAAKQKFPEQIEAVDRLQGLRDLRFGVLE